MEGEQKKTRKPKQPEQSNRSRGTSARGQARKQQRPGTTRGLSRATRATLKDLTPDRLRTLWALSQPDRPEFRAMLEKLYRLPY